MASDQEKHLSDSSDKGDVEHLNKPDSKLALSEEEALARSKADPESMLPIYLTFAPNDTDNPRNWAWWKKWYITCFASMLNVVT